ncbi:unnamed protein product [Diabrotica balteata]|uniref:Uncharacterized protein n=1 Tax=Diabrotica balteata TaxID=107213 RepID=A0A9P0DUF6_DIABA|nr:unnamed protein product [Diabrotica balteata]
MEKVFIMCSKIRKNYRKHYTNDEVTPLLTSSEEIKTFSKSFKYACLAAAVVVAAIVGIVLLVILKPKEVLLHKGAVVTNSPGCSDVGVDIMIKGGTVADAAIATLFCESVCSPQSMSVGAGFLMTIYNRTTREVITLNAREVAPINATQDMFAGNAMLSSIGGLAVGVTGELRGYWQLYHKHGGGVPWKDLVQPSIDLCFNGIPVSKYIENALKKTEVLIRNNTLLSEIFIDPKTNATYVEGDFYKRPKLGEFLKVVAEEGGDTLHNGSFTESFVKDIQDNGGIITVEDMHNYSPRWQPAISTQFKDGRTMHTHPLPSSGPILALMLNVWDNYLDTNNPESIENYQKMIETFKFAYAKRTLLGDENFVDVTEVMANLTSKSFAEEIRNLINLTATSSDITYYGANATVPIDQGTANLCFLAPNGDAIVVTSTINGMLGAGFVSESTGIILNNQMDDFSSPSIINSYNIPPSPANFIVPGKQPMSSMVPTIVVENNGDVVMAVGAAGGSKIITSVAQMIVRHLWFDMGIKATSDLRRFHHQLWPMSVTLEPLYETEAPEIADGLRKIGHEVAYADGQGFAAATCISTRDGSVTGVWDRRRSGTVTYL